MNCGLDSFCARVQKEKLASNIEMNGKVYFCIGILSGRLESKIPKLSNQGDCKLFQVQVLNFTNTPKKKQKSENLVFQEDKTAFWAETNSVIPFPARSSISSN